MIYSLAAITSAPQQPYTRSIIQKGFNTGISFCIQADSEPTAFELCLDGCTDGKPLELTELVKDGDLYYYNGQTDIVTYLTGLGFEVPAGRYRFKVVATSVTVFTSLFIIEPATAPPAGLGEYSDDYNEDYTI